MNLPPLADLMNWGWLRIGPPIYQHPGSHRINPNPGIYTYNT
jgi:hypothetical protein